MGIRNKSRAYYMEKKAVYYENSKGRKYVKEFINGLDSKTRAKVLARIIYLGEHWHEMGRPEIDYLGDKLYEIRIQFAHGRIRILYAYMFKNYIVLLHGIVKKTAEISETDKLKAKKRMLDFQIRYNEGRIKLK